MKNYLIKRLLLLPITLLAIILVNFIILNLAPNDPAIQTQRSATGDATRQEKSDGTTHDLQYLQFREHFGLTLPMLFNGWPLISEEKLIKALTLLAFEKEKMGVKEYNKLYTLWGDRARFIMPLLLSQIQNENHSKEIKEIAVKLFVRGGTKQGVVKSKLSTFQREENKKIATNNMQLAAIFNIFQQQGFSGPELYHKFHDWLEQCNFCYHFSSSQKLKIFFLETRLFRYMSRVLLLDFGQLRADRNKSVLTEVTKRIKYSLTLAIFPMLLTFALCLCFGMVMALNQNRWPDISLNIFFLILFSIPIFVAAPFLIEKIALSHTLPFTNIAIPYTGFNSSQEIYDKMTSLQRLGDIALHLLLPLVAIIYGSVAIQTRLARTAFLEVMNQDFIRTARAKGVKKFDLLIKHVGRAASITIITSLTASLGLVLGGSLIIETIFEINGFGRFFYDAIVQRDLNVVLFSAIAGSVLTLLGYLIADISYTLLDPRISLERTH